MLLALTEVLLHQQFLVNQESLEIKVFLEHKVLLEILDQLVYVE